MKNKKLKKYLIDSTTKYLFLIFFLIFAFVSSFAQPSDLAFSYNSIHYRGSTTVDINNQTQNCQFNFVNVIDSFLYIQLHVAGIEIGRALVSPNNILFINKLQKEYFNGNYSVFQDIVGMDIDFYTLQAIFNGVPINILEGIEISYQGELIENEHSFFKTLICESEYFSLAFKIEVKKVTFNDAPKVTAIVPKNFSEIIVERN